MKWVFLTLTVRNVDGKDLKDTMDQMTKAWNQFAGYARFKKSIRGNEVTPENIQTRWRMERWIVWLIGMLV